MLGKILTTVRVLIEFGFIGGLITLATHRSRKVRATKRLCLVLLKELETTQFYPSGDQPNFVNFSSQTFDTSFREIIEKLPASLVDDLVRYHQLMKSMEEMKQVTMPMFHAVQPTSFYEAQELHGRLLERLHHQNKRSWISIFLKSNETCSKSLFTPGGKT